MPAGGWAPTAFRVFGGRKDPEEVAVAAEKALFEPNPKRRYMVVPNQVEAELTIKQQIEQLVQLNEGNPTRTVVSTRQDA